MEKIPNRNRKGSEKSISIYPVLERLHYLSNKSIKELRDEYFTSQDKIAKEKMYLLDKTCLSAAKDFDLLAWWSIQTLVLNYSEKIPAVQFRQLQSGMLDYLKREVKEQ